MSLSDLFCVERHKSNFLDLVKNKVDITFANEQEIMSLLNTENITDLIQQAKDMKKLIVITRGEKGSLAINGDKVVECAAHKNLKVVDLTGAGDLFAGGIPSWIYKWDDYRRELKKRHRNVFESYSNNWGKNKLNYFFFFKTSFTFFWLDYSLSIFFCE